MGTPELDSGAIEINVDSARRIHVACNGTPIGSVCLLVARRPIGVPSGDAPIGLACNVLVYAYSSGVYIRFRAARRGA